MPFKHNASRRYRIPPARYRVTNWPAYKAGLRRRGDLTLWLDEAALAGWSAPQRITPGGQPLYSDLAIELVLTLRLVFHLALALVHGPQLDCRCHRPGGFKPNGQSLASLPGSSC